MISLLRPLLLLIVAATLPACASRQTVATEAGGEQRFIVVRHAEKVGDGSRNPALSTAGRARAQALAERLRGARLQAVYSSDFQRTRDTAGPSAAASALPVTVYDAGKPAPELAKQLRRDHPRGNVLVVGHSNTVPDIIAALCNCTPAAMDESEYDRFSEVRIDAAGKASLHVGTYGDASASP